MVPSGLRRYLVPVVGFAVALTLTLAAGSAVGAARSGADGPDDRALGTTTTSAPLPTSAPTAPAAATPTTATPVVPPVVVDEQSKNKPGSQSTGPELSMTVVGDDGTALAEVDRAGVRLSFKAVGRADGPSDLSLKPDGTFRVPRPKERLAEVCVRPPPGAEVVPDVGGQPQRRSPQLWCVTDSGLLNPVDVGQSVPLTFKIAKAR